MNSEAIRLNPEWEQWISYAILTGHPDESILQSLEASGNDPELVRSFIGELRQSPLLGVAQDFARQLGQTRWLLDLQKQVRENQQHAVPRISATESVRFFEDFLAANRPVILEGLCEGWPALEHWNPQSLKSNHGHHAIEYTQYQVQNNRHEPTQVQASFSDFLDRVHNPNDTDPIYWTAYNQGDSEASLVKALEQDIVFPSDYCSPQADMRTYFWIGPEGTRSGLHFDPYNVLFVQVVGSKRFLLYPPQDIPRAYLQNEFFSMVDAENPDLSAYPKFAETKPLVVEVQAGETLLLPVGWLHQVRSLSPSISVSLTCLKLPSGQSNFYTSPSEFRGLL